MCCPYKGMTIVKNHKKLEIVIATRNKKKLKEIKEIMKGMRLKFLTLDDFPGAPYVKENGKTFLENAAKKARIIAKFTGKLTLGDVVFKFTSHHRFQKMFHHWCQYPIGTSHLFAGI